jgi:uncharacterized membrane protein
MIEPIFKELTFYLAYGVEAAAALVIAIAAARAFVRALRLFVGREPPATATAAQEHGGPEPVRLELGRWLGLALEFEIAADILRTAVAPTWNEIGQLAAIILLRTALNFFLQKEVERASALASSRARDRPPDSGRDPA